MNDLKEISRFVIGALKSAGADKAQCVVKSTETHEFNMDGGKFSLFRTLFDNAVTMEAFTEGRRGVTLINKFDKESIESGAASCLSSAMSAQKDDCWDIAPKAEPKIFTEGEVNPDTEKLFMRTKELACDIGRLFPKVIIEQMVTSYIKKETVYESTTGNEYVEHSGCYSIDLMYSAHDGEKASSFFGTGVTVSDLDTPFIECADIKKNLADIEKQLDTSPLDGKFTGTAIIPASCLGEFLYYAASGFAGDRPILSGTSIWKDKLGQKVASDCLTVSVSPLDSRIVCGERITDEGYVSENYDLIKNGVLKSFMLSLYTANKTGNSRAKNSDGAFVIEGGDVSYDDIIKNTKRGIIIGRFSGGQPNDNGDFSGVAKNSFLVEDGKITKALSETMISGNLASLLMNVISISKETVCDGSSVLPSIAFDGVTVIGK